jgi:hypothetical protein
MWKMVETERRSKYYFSEFILSTVSQKETMEFWPEKFTRIWPEKVSIMTLYNLEP